MDESITPPSSLPSQPTRVLIAGNSTDVPSIRRLLRELPRDAYGQVIIEVASAIQQVPLAAPPQVAITWLRRHEHSSDLRHTVGAVRGEALARSLEAWMTEWLPDDEPAPSYLTWIGSRSDTRISQVYGRLRSRVRQREPLPGELGH